MKKLTAGIFAAILTVVGTNAANASIASKGYVDENVSNLTTALGNKVDSKDFESSTTMMAGQISGLDTRVTAAEGDIDALQAADTAMGTRVSNAESKITTIEGQQTEQDNKISALETNISKMATSENFEALESTVAGHTTSITNLTTKDSELDAAIKANTAAIEKHKTDATAALEASEALAAQTYEKITVVDALEGTVSGHTASIDSMSKEIDNLDSTKADKETIGTVAEGKTVVQMIEDAKTAATYDDTKVKADIASNAASIQTLTSELDIKADQSGLDATNAKVTANETAITNLTAEVATKLSNPTPACSDYGAKCALVISGMGADNQPILEWEVIQRGTTGENAGK